MIVSPHAAQMIHCVTVLCLVYLVNVWLSLLYKYILQLFGFTSWWEDTKQLSCPLFSINIFIKLYFKNRQNIQWQQKNENDLNVTTYMKKCNSWAQQFSKHWINHRGQLVLLAHCVPLINIQKLHRTHNQLIIHAFFWDVRECECNNRVYSVQSLNFAWYQISPIKPAIFCNYHEI